MGLSAITALEITQVMQSLKKNGDGDKANYVGSMRDCILLVIDTKWICIREIATLAKISTGRAALYLQAMACAGYLETRWVTVRAPSYNGRTGKLVWRTEYKAKFFSTEDIHSAARD